MKLAQLIKHSIAICGIRTRTWDAKTHDSHMYSVNDGLTGLSESSKWN